MAKNIGNTDIRGYDIMGYYANIRGYKGQITVIFPPRKGGWGGSEPLCFSDNWFGGDELKPNSSA